jgi:hypothetical protein
MATIKRRRRRRKGKITIIGKDVEKWELQCLVDETIKWCSLYGEY